VTTSMQQSAIPHAAGLRVLIDPEARQGTVRVQIIGELDAWTAPVLDVAMAGLRGRVGIAGQRRRDILLDLGRLRFVDSAGLSSLGQSRAGLMAGGCRVRSTQPHAQASRLLSLATRRGWLSPDFFGPDRRS
jgi:anti-anti-sigma factor